MRRIQILILGKESACEPELDSGRLCCTDSVQVVSTNDLDSAITTLRSDHPPDVVVFVGDDAAHLVDVVRAAAPMARLVVTGTTRASSTSGNGIIDVLQPYPELHIDQLHLLRTAIETTQIGVTFTDLDGRIVYTNSAEAAMHGYSQEDLVGTNAHMLAPKERWHRLSDQEKTKIERWNREVVNLRRDGTEFPVRLLSDVVTDSTGEPIGIVTTCEDISHRKAIEEELHRSEHLLRSVVSGTPVVLFAIDQNGTFTLSEGLGLKALGMEPGQVVGTSVFDLYREVPELTANIRRALAGESFSAAVDVNGQFFETAHSPITDCNGEVEAVIGVATDITARMVATKKLENEKKRYRSLFEAAPEAILIASIEQDGPPRVVDCNDRCEEMFKLTSEELVGKVPTDLMPEFQPDGRSTAEFISQVISTLEVGSIISFDCDHSRADGEPFPTGVRVSRIEIEGADYIQVLIRDITEQVDAEAQLRTLLQAVESMDLGLTIADPTGKIIYTNPAEAVMHGYDRDELIGEMANVFSANVSNNRSRTSLNIEQSSNWKRESTNRRKDGSCYPVQLSSVPVTDPEGSVIGLITTSEDITLRKEAEEALQRTKEIIERLHSVAQSLQSCESVEEVASITMTAAMTDLGIDSCFFAGLDANALKTFQASPDLAGSIFENNAADLAKALEERATATISALQTGDTLQVYNDLQADPQLGALWPDARSMASALLDKTAVFVAFDRLPQGFDEHSAHLIELLLGHATEALRRVHLQAELRHQATCDPLTGVRNRRFLSDSLDTEMERARRSGKSINFLMIDIDRFKEINDRFGHQTGDHVLVNVAAVIARQVRRIDSVIRYGGDEFLVLLPESNSDVDMVIQRIRSELAVWNQQESSIDLEVTLSIGKAAWDPIDPVPIKHVLAAADCSMYAMKKS